MPRNKLSKFDKELREQISKNLKRYTKGLTQYQLSDMTGIPVSTLSGYFAMRSTPNAGNVQKIADALHIKKSDIDPRFSDSLLNQETEITELTQRDEREIESDLEDMMNSVSSAAYTAVPSVGIPSAFNILIAASPSAVTGTFTTISAIIWN